MTKTKRVFRYFTIADYKEEEKFLSDQHSKGWEISAITLPGIYTFKECEKEDYIYQLDFPDIQDNSKREYIRMFEDCGWEYLFDFVQFSYFRMKKDINDNQSIFTDDESKVEMIDKIYKRRMIPIVVLFLCCVIPNFFNFLNYNSDVRTGISILSLLVSFACIAVMAYCGVKLNRLKEESKK